MLNPRSSYWPVCAGLLLLMLRCTLDKPAAPSWKTSWELPLIHKTYTMTDLSDESEYFELRESGLFLTLHQEVESFTVGDLLNMEGVAQQYLRFPFGEISGETEMPLDSVLIRSAEIREGQARLMVLNPYNASVDVEFELNDVRDSSGAPFRFVMSVPPGQTQTQTLSLNRWIFTPELRQDRNVTSFSGRLIHGGGDGDGREIDMILHISDLTFERLTGIVKHLALNLHEKVTHVDIPRELAGLEFASSSVFLKLCGIPFSSTVDLTVDATETLNPYAGPLNLQGDIPALADGEIHMLPLSSGRATDFVNSLPTRIVLNGSFRMSDSDAEISLTSQRRISGEVVIESPLTFHWPASRVESEVDTLNLDEEWRDLLADQVQAARLTADVLSRLPMGVSVDLLFSTTRGDSTIFDAGYAPDLVVPMTVASAVISGDPGEAQEAVSTRLTIDLDQNEVLIFSSPTVYFAAVFQFPGTGGMVRVRPRDWIQIQSVMQVEILADFDPEEEGA